MGITILGITAFQVVWLYQTYEREKRTLERNSNITFRETVHSLQAAKFHMNVPGGGTDSLMPLPLPGGEEPMRKPLTADQKMMTIINVLRDRATDSLQHKIIVRDSLQKGSPRHDRIVRFLYEMDAMQDSVKVSEIGTAFALRQEQQNIEVPFAIARFNRERENRRAYNEVTLGFAHPVTYQLQLGNIQPYLLRRIMAPIFLSLFIVGFTILSFILLYRNLLRQRKLAEIKNEFISNITHELKTPIATVSVAIEALRSFNASLNAERTKEYLDISHNELQRLSLLVDKVLKLSMFEKKEAELKYERLDMKDLVAEVTASMRLQAEKYGADVTVEATGDAILNGDRLHLVSVIFNLLDNALKYSREKPRIHINTTGTDTEVRLCITDSGIGISKEYHDKVFEKFFRVPTGNLHNAKGYGLGLSYVAHVVQKHKGTIRIESAEGKGSAFVINLPKNMA